MKTEVVDTGINHPILVNRRVGKCPFPALYGHHHERSIYTYDTYICICTVHRTVNIIETPSREGHICAVHRLAIFSYYVSV